MSIVLFKEITTEKALSDLEEKASKYDGLYVEMENKEERKFVKDHASLINGLLKKVDRARIDIKKEYGVMVEDEALLIKNRLEEANKPFTLLISEYKIVREKQLAKEKEIQAAKDLAAEMPIMHEEAISMNELHDFKIQQEINIQKERDDEIARQARLESEKKAEQAELDKIQAQKQAKADAEQAIIDAEKAEQRRLKDIELAAKQAKQAEILRQEQEKEAEEEKLRKLEANKKHVGKVRGEIKEHLIKSCGLDNDLAKKVVIALTKTDRVTINY